MTRDPRFLKGIDQFNRGLFYECHETIEEIWLEEHGRERALYQGIIQVAAGYFKWQQDVPAGAIKLFRSGLNKLEPYAPRCLGLDIAAFVARVEADLELLEAAHAQRSRAPELRIPRLRFEDTASNC